MLTEARRVAVHLVFEDCASVWVQRRLRRGFRHVWAFFPAWWPLPAPVSVPCIVRLDARTWGLEPDVYWLSADTAAALCVGTGARVVRIEVRWPARDKRIVPRIATCVSDCKRLLGWRSLRAQTPFGLYRLALERGGVELGLDGQPVLRA